MSLSHLVASGKVQAKVLQNLVAREGQSAGLFQSPSVPQQVVLFLLLERSASEMTLTLAVGAEGGQELFDAV